MAAGAAQPSPYAEKVSEKNRIEHDLYKRVKTTTSAKMLSDVDVVLQMQLFDSSD